MQFSNPYQQILAGGMAHGTTKQQRRAMRADARTSNPVMGASQAQSGWYGSGYVPGYSARAPGCWVKGKYVIPCPTHGWRSDVCKTAADCGPIEVCVDGTCKPVEFTAPSSPGYWSGGRMGIAANPGPEITAPVNVGGKPKCPAGYHRCGSFCCKNSSRVTAELTPGSSMRSRRVAKRRAVGVPGGSLRCKEGEYKRCAVDSDGNKVCRCCVKVLGGFLPPVCGPAL